MTQDKKNWQKRFFAIHQDFVLFSFKAHQVSKVTTQRIQRQNILMSDILLRYNSLPCGTQRCTRMATRHHGQRLRKKKTFMVGRSL